MAEAPAVQKSLEAVLGAVEEEEELPEEIRNADAEEMAETIFGDEITITSATYTGDNNASGIYSNADTVSPGVAPSDSGVILSTGNVRQFTNRNGGFNQSSNRSSDMNGPDTVEGSSDVTTLQTFDASVLEVSVGWVIRQRPGQACHVGTPDILGYRRPPKRQALRYTTSR